MLAPKIPKYGMTFALYKNHKRITKLIPVYMIKMVTTYQPSKKVLIVDDDSSIRETLSNFLSSKGFSVESAENGYMALKILKRSFDFLIVDVDIYAQDEWH